MHIPEGYLPAPVAAGWTAAAALAVTGSWLACRKSFAGSGDRLGWAAAGAFAFMLSSLKVPSLAGSCSHPTGLGVASVRYGAPAATLLGLLVLLFQALLLAHGGLTTLGANLVAMAVVGPWVVVSCLSLLTRLGWRRRLAVTVAATLGDLITYCCTAFQLAWAFPDPQGGFGAAVGQYLAVFAVTQIPLALGDGWLTGLVVERLEQ